MRKNLSLVFERPPSSRQTKLLGKQITQCEIKDITLSDEKIISEKP